MPSIAYLPYLKSSEFEFGKFTFKPFTKCTEKEFGLENYSFLQEYFNRYVDLAMNPLDIIVIGVEGKYLHAWGRDNEIRVQEAADLLSFLATWDDFAFSPLSSDNFTVVIKDFDASTKNMGIQSGSYIRTTAFYTQKMAEKILFVKPDYIPSCDNRWFEKIKRPEIFAGVLCLFKQLQDDEYRRILRAVRVFNNACANHQRIGYFDRILLLVTGMEILLESRNKFEIMALKLLKINKKSELADEKKVCSFIEKIYEIRSMYSHGREMKESYAIHQDYGEVFRCGKYLFGIMLKEILRTKGCIVNKEEISGLSDIELHMDINFLLLKMDEKVSNDNED